MRITIMDTDIIIAFAEILLEIRAAIGEAKALPTINPKTADHLAPFSIVMNVSELINAMKKRDSFTVPNEKRGLRPPAISVDNTIEPQPPPPTASINPPPKPNKPMRLIFAELRLRFKLIDLDRMTIPNINVYSDTKGLVYML